MSTAIGINYQCDYCECETFMPSKGKKEKPIIPKGWVEMALNGAGDNKYYLHFCSGDCIGKGIEKIKGK